jgi:hypothetical protein
MKTLARILLHLFHSPLFDDTLMFTSHEPLTILKQAGIRIAALALFAFSASAHATPINLIVNGGFEANAGNGQVGANTSINGWSSSGGYNFIFAAGTADTTGAMTPWFGAPLMLWGANNGGANALAQSSNGGYIFGADGDYGVAPIEQWVSGLTAGRQYELSFEWAAAQQAGFYGDTTEAWIVNFGNEVQATGIYALASQSSSNWMNETMTFTASGSNMLLSFLARGTPEGMPPFSLLDGVSLVELPNLRAVPEPGSWLLFGAACVAALLGARRRRPAARAS